MKKLYIFLFFLISVQLGFSQTVDIVNVTKYGRFNSCSSTYGSPIVTATMITSDGSAIVDGDLVITDPCGFTTLRINISNIRWNKEPGANWFHGIFFPLNSGITVSGIVMPAGWADFPSCTGASCSAGETGGQGFYFDGTSSNSCCSGAFANDGIPYNNYGDIDMGCTESVEVQFEMTFCNSQVETATLSFDLLGKADGNTGCWTTPDTLDNRISFSINTVASDIPLYGDAPVNPQVITECENGGADLNYIAELTAVCGTGDNVTWWDAAEGGNQIGTGSPFLYDTPGTACPEGMIIYASCCPDGEGCERSAVVIGACQPPSDEPIFDPIPPQCPGGTNPLPSVSIDGATGNWTPVFDPDNTTVYTFTPDPGQCATEPVQITVEILPTVNPTFDPIPSQCPGEPNPLPPASIEGYTGTWTPAYNPNTTTTYTFTPDDGCASEITLELIIEEEVIPDFVLTDTYCQSNGIIELPNLSDNDYPGNWSPSNQVDLNIIGTTEYTFIPSDVECFQPFVIEITVEETLVPTFIEMDPICEISIPPSLPNPNESGITGTWDPPVIDPDLEPGIYDFTFLTDGQCSEDVTIQIEILEELAVEVDIPLEYCQGNGLIILPTNLNGVEGVWIPSVIDTDDPGIETYTFYPDAGQCALDTPFTIEIFAQPVLNTLSVQEICDDDFDGLYETNLTTLNPELGGGTGISYIYYASLTDMNNDNPIPSNQWNNYTFTFLPTTIYIVGESGEGCRSVGTAVQFEARDIVAHNVGPFGPIEYCPENTVDLTQFEVNINGSSGVIFSYYSSISNAQNESGEILNTGEFSPEQNQTSIFVRLDLGGYCPAIVEILLERLPTPSIELNQTSFELCPGNTFEATASSDDPSATFAWYLDDVEIGIGSTISISENGTYTVIVTSVNGCINEETLTISTPPTPIITGIEIGPNYVIVSGSSGDGGGSLEYSLDGILWQNSPQFNNLIPGEVYTIYVREDGCMKDSYEVVILNVPNFISPNNDGKNDTWEIRGIEATQGATIKIFDRFGKIFVDRSFSGNYQWDGKYLGNNVTTGDYWYIIQIPSDGIIKSQKFVGNISVKSQ